MSETIDPISASPEAPRSPQEFPAEEAVEVVPEIRKIAIVGEIPFAGRALTQALLEKGFAVRVLCPDENAEKAVRAAQAAAAPCEGASGEDRVETIRGDLESVISIEMVLSGAYGVCFLSPITMHGRMYRAAQHLEDVNKLVKAAQNGAIRKLVYHSALGAHPDSKSEALRQAASAEEIIHAAKKFEDFRVRTGPLMGRNDGFLSEIVAKAKKSSPVMRILGYGSTTVQPLHIADMASCLARVFMDQPKALQPGYYCLAGPEVTTLLDLIDRAAERLHSNKLKVHVPLFLMQLVLSLRAGSDLREQFCLLFDNFYTEENDAPRLLNTGSKLITPTQAQEEILGAAAL